jgi:hypothetical protein
MTERLRLVLRFFLVTLLWSGLSVDASAQKVAIVAADFAPELSDVRAKLIGAGITDVTIVDVGSGPAQIPTPTLDELLQYDAILSWSARSYAFPEELGNVLADYADSGRGVVQAIHSFNPAVPLRLDGRWRSGAYEPFSLSLSFRTRNLTLIKTQPLHPILNGVSAFDGGTSSHHGVVTAQGCGDVVAHWSNGQPLVAARFGPQGGRVIGLNFYPPSSSVSSFYWKITTDGAILLANALRFAAEPAPAPSDGPAVALLAAEEPGLVEDVRCKLQTTNLFSRIDAIDVASTASPTLATLLQYDAVLTWSNASYGDSEGLGNVLADYVDHNRGVVQSGFSFYASSGPRLDGRWRTDGYRPFTEADSAPVPLTPLTLLPAVPGHPILSGVTNFSGGTGSSHSAPVSLDAATTLVAIWSDGEPMVAFGVKAAGGRVVGLNMLPPSSDVRSDLWDRSTHGVRLIANTLLFAANHWPTDADAGSDQSVEVRSPSGTSFTLSASAIDLDGDDLAFVWSGAASGTGNALIIDVPPPTAPNKTRTHTVTVTVTDGRGGEATDSVDLTVTDTAPPVMANVPSGVLTADATGATGADVPYGPVTATDLVDGSVTVTCSHSGVFPIGDTVVTCSASDSRENVSTAQFTVTVNGVEEEEEDPDPATPGRVFGYGFIRDDDMRYEFAFNASERASGVERGSVLFSVKSSYDSRHRRAGLRSGHFVSGRVNKVTFGEDRTVLFSGTGRWNGLDGYRFEVFAVDPIARRSHDDIVHITITSETGEIVAEADGRLGGGNVHFVRMRR